jgi:WD domain, G-beta repeat
LKNHHSQNFAGVFLKIEKNFSGKGHQGAVTSITYNGNNSLFTCGKDCKVIEWNVTSGSEGKTYKIGNEIPASLSVFSQSKRLLTGSKHLKLWNLTNGELIHTFTGHQTKVIRLQTFVYAGKQFFISSAENNRFPAMWCLDGDTDKKSENSISTFAVDDAAQFLNIKLIENTLHLCVVTVSGTLHFFKVDMESAQTKKPVKPKLVMRIVADSTEAVESINILAASIQSADSVKVVYGEMNLLQCETIVSTQKI